MQGTSRQTKPRLHVFLLRRGALACIGSFNTRQHGDGKEVAVEHPHVNDFLHTGQLDLIFTGVGHTSQQRLKV